MKLWLKQTLITLAVILLSVSLCLYFFVAKEANGLIQQAIQNGERDTAVFCDHLSTLDRTSSMSYDTGGIARQSLIQYTFSTYAHLLQTGACSWSLVMDGRYFYNTAVNDPLTVLPGGNHYCQPHRGNRRNASADLHAEHDCAANARYRLPHSKHR